MVTVAEETRVRQFGTSTFNWVMVQPWKKDFESVRILWGLTRQERRTILTLLKAKLLLGLHMT